MTKRPFLVRSLVVGALLTLSAPIARTQGYPFSQRGSVTQMVAFTKVSVVYGRPVARGRALFGALVPWDSVWHPGADSATRITFSKDVLIEGKNTRFGSYRMRPDLGRSFSAEPRTSFTSRIPARDSMSFV